MSKTPIGAVLRKKWPRVRVIEVKGVKLFQADLRKAGTDGRQESFSTRDEAMQRAATAEAEFAGNGTQGLAMPAELRAMAFQAERLLAPFGKTVLQGAEFYRDFLIEEQRKDASALVGILADQWRAEKEAGHKRKLATKTLAGIRQAAALLNKHFPNVRVKALTKAEAEAFVFSLGGEYYQKENTRRLCSQFFIWCMDNELTEHNPFNKKLFNMHLREKDVEIFSSVEAANIMRLCEGKHKDIAAYCAVSLFAGLRPGEAAQLTWENIHLSERTIHVLGNTSKSGETHNVHIEDNLFAWLSCLRPENAEGYICPQGTTLARRKQALHAALGFRAAGENIQEEEITQDIMRHSYASHWLARYGNRAQLAENMANSVKVIKDHYKRVVGKVECAAYWSILPALAAQRLDLEEDEIRQQALA